MLHPQIKEMLVALGRIVLTWTLDILYLIIYIFTFGNRTIHEGIFFKSFFTYVNWNFNYCARPAHFFQPKEEKEICNIVRDALRVRVTGAGHSFNKGIECDNVLINLDNYSSITNIDRKKFQVTVRAGMRLRDFTKEIEKAGMALPTQGSTNAQALGGLVASDLHGTAPVQGYLSNQIVWLKVVDAKGIVHTLEKGKQDDELNAVTGAVGALGVVIELCIQCVPKYRLEKQITIVNRQIVHDNIEQLLSWYDHLSFYYIGGTTIKSCRMNTWNRTVADNSFFYQFRHFSQEIFDFILCGFILGIGRVTQKLDKFGWIGMLIMKLFMHQSLTTNAAESFSRQLFYRHDEIEYGIPQEKFVQVMEELEEMLRTNHDFVTIIEVRFAGASDSLIGPGSSRRTVFIELAPSLSIDSNPLFKDAEKLFMKHGGKPHLGKWTTATPKYMKQVHGANFDKFLTIRRQYDPYGKFTNDFTNQVFGPANAAPLVASSSTPVRGVFDGDEN